ncbi:MAG: hypothetical protein CV090_05080, partial [Nitrospira sp. WS238]|nr:hypothetical protein [Nitrospira sp. WS238]
MSVRLLFNLRTLSVIVILIYAGCDWSSPEKKIAKHRERAEQYMEKEQYPEAIIEYQNVIQLAPNNSDVHYRLALAHLKHGSLPSLQGAFAELTRTVELDKTNYDAQLKLGELYLLGNEPAKARERAEIILASTPENTDSLILRGRSLINETRYQEGIAELKKAIEADPNTMATYINLARAYFATKNLSATEATLNQALTINPRSLEVILALGDFRNTTGKPDQAEALYRQAIEMAPDKDALYLKLAGHYQTHNRLTDAEATLRKLADHTPHSEMPQIHLGDFFTTIGQLDKAFASYEKATAINPVSEMARDKVIAHYLDTGKLNEAEPKIRAILAKDEHALMGRFFDARLKLARSGTDDAITLLQGVLKDRPQFAGAHHYLGLAWMKKQQPAQARSAFMEALKYQPSLGEAHAALAQLYLAEGSLDLALEQAQAVLQVNPRNIQAAILLGDIHLRKGDLVKSRQIFESIAKVLPKEPIGPYRLGLVARAEKNTAKALTYFEEGLSRRPTAIEPLTQIAMIKTAQGNSGEARQRVIRQVE